MNTTANYEVEIRYPGFPDFSHNISFKTKKSPEDIENSLREAATAEEWIEACFHLEAVSDTKSLEALWDTGYSRFGGSTVFLEALSYFYYRSKKHHKVLETIQKVLSKSASLLSVKVGISSAYSLAQYNLVWDFFLKLSPSDREKLEDDLLSRTATSAMMLTKYKEAEKILELMRRRLGAPQLPSLEETLLKEFGSHAERKNWMNSVSQKVSKRDELKKVSLNEMVTYASALMFEGAYDTALKTLIQYREFFEMN